MKAGWQICRLEDVCEKITDGSHFSPKTVSADGYPYITVSDIQDDIIDFSRCKLINKADYETLCRNGCNPRPGDVLFSKDGTVGKVSQVNIDKDFVVLSSLAIIRPDAKIIDTTFLKYLMKAPFFLDAAVGMKTGVAIRRIILKNLRAIAIPIPPLPEQQRIVAILDEAFDSIATAKASAEQNLKNARELFDSYLQSVFTQRGEGWVEKRLGELCNKIQDGAHNSPPIQFAESGSDRFMYITSKNIRNNYVDLTNVSYVNVDFHNSIYPRCKPEVGDVLLTKDGANTGNVTINTIDEPFSLLSSVCLIKPNTNKLLASFLKYYIQSPCGLMSIVGKMTGTAIKRIVLKDIKNAIVPVPDIEAQRSIVARLDELSFETQRLEAIYKQKIAALDELKQSLLQKAFAGEL